MQKTLRSMAADPNMPGVKKNDIFLVDPREIAEDEGFNLRNYDDPEVEAHIQAFADSYAAGRFVPPLVVRTTDDGRIVPVEGHCSRLGALKAIAQGADLQFVPCVPFRGNDVERIEVMLRSAEGLKLKPLEMALGFLRLTRMGHSPAEISASMSGKVGAARVEQLLRLATANHDVHQLVRSGAVPADVAIEALREHGEKTGEFLAAQLEKAKAIGKSTVTKGVITGPKLPPKTVSSFMSTVRQAMVAIPSKTRKQVASYVGLEPEQLAGKVIEVDAAFMVELMRAHEMIQEEERKAAQKLEAKRLQTAQADLDE